MSEWKYGIEAWRAGDQLEGTCCTECSVDFVADLPPDAPVYTVGEETNYVTVCETCARQFIEYRDRYE